jgi:Fe2+ or Zn2+ uptake regulation protein
MAGTKGMKHTKNRAGTLRARAWQSMRILRRFSVADLCRTVAIDPLESDYQNLKKWVRMLFVHGVVSKEGRPLFRTAGDFQSYRLRRDSGPDHPLVCERCGQSITAKFCENKETKKQTEEETKTDTPEGGPA